jgi:hypothetical protein
MIRITPKTTQVVLSCEENWKLLEELIQVFCALDTETESARMYHSDNISKSHPALYELYLVLLGDKI